MNFKNLVLLISLLILFFCAGLNLYSPIQRIPYTVFINRNEGWNAYHTLDVASGKPLYQKSLTPVNYPPLSFYIFATTSRFGADPLMTGRIVSLLSLFSVSASVGLVLFFMGSTLFECLFCALLCLSFFGFIAPSYIAMNDPQLLAHALMLLGLVLFFRNQKKNMFLFAFFLAIGVFIKNNLIALPLAACLYMVLHDRKNAFRFIAFLGGLGVLLALLFQLQSNGLFFRSLLLSRSYSIDHLKALTTYLFYIVLFPLLLCLPLLFARKEKKQYLIYYFFIFSFLTAIYFSGGSGTTVNMFFDSIIAAVMIIGLNLLALRKQKGPARHVYVLFVVFVTIFFVIFGIANYKHTDFKEEEKKTLQDIALLKSYPDPVFCAEPTLCYFAHKRFELDSFMPSEMVITGGLSSKTLVGGIVSGHFSIIQWAHVTDEDEIHQKIYKKFESAISSRYRFIKRTQFGNYYVRKT